ncbi:putative transposase, ISlxx1 [Mycobacterium kansasii 824]|nr:putative transposase, ISlxx1 [Mycobacterium kansasii 824]
MIMTEDPIKTVCHYAQVLKAPRIRESAARLADQARDGGWSHEEYLAAVLSGRSRPEKPQGQRPASALPDSQPEIIGRLQLRPPTALNRDMIAHLGTGAFLTKARNVVLLGHPAPEKPTSLSGWPSRPPKPDTASRSPRPWTGSPDSKPPQRRPTSAELVKLRRIGLLVVDEVLSQEFLCSGRSTACRRLDQQADSSAIATSS